MNKRIFSFAGCMILGLLYGVGAGAADSPTPPVPYGRGDEANIPNGVIGVSLQVGAERIGDPAVLYVAMVHPQSPAQRGGLTHGDEIVTVDGTAVAGKSYEEVVRMIRGAVGTTVTLGVKGEQGIRQVAVTRVAGDSLSKGPSGSHGNPSR